jgi:O-antigen ligase
VNRKRRSIDRYGRSVLLVVFVVLLGGRFTLDRVGDYPAWDLRWFGAFAVAALAYAWATVEREKVGPAARLGWFPFFLAAWVGWLLFSAFWAPPEARLSAYVTDLVLLFALVGAGWAVASRAHPWVVQSVWWWLFAAGLVYVAAALVEGPGPQSRYSALGGGPNVFVRVMALATLAALFLAIVRRLHWVLLGMPVFVVGAFLSGSRGGVLSLTAVVLVGAVPLWRRMSGRLKTSLLLGALPVVALAPFFVNPAWFTGLGDRFIQQTLVEQYDSGRSDILDGAWRLFVEYPVTGAGLDGYYGLIGHLAGWEYPHNLVLATAAEGGLIGLLALLGALLAALTAVRAARPLSADALGFALCALFMLVASMFSGDYYDSRFLWFFLGLAVIAARRDSAPSPQFRRCSAATEVSTSAGMKSGTMLSSREASSRRSAIRITRPISRATGRASATHTQAISSSHDMGYS